MRRITGRRATLDRRGATQELVARYEAVSTRLRRASAFADELNLTALRQHAEVQSLHAEIQVAREAAAAAERRVAELRAVGADAVDPAADAARFELRRHEQARRLALAAATLLEQQLPAARALRDTAQDLHEELQHYVIAATAIVDGAGRRIQVVGAAADAPLVVAELQRSLSELGEAMRATELYLEHVGDLVAQRLPDLSARLRAEVESDHALAEADLSRVDRDRARAAAERGLRAAADREVRDLLRDRG
jgi:hypothetical protein